MKWITIIIGTIIIFSLLVYILSWFGGVRRAFDQVNKAMIEIQDKEQLITQDDIDVLPELMRKYMDRVGATGKPHVESFQLRFSGEMSLEEGGEYYPITGNQFSYLTKGIRNFYMKMHVRGLPVHGHHFYDSNDASMKVRILDLFSVVNESGQLMQKAETVTYLNDLVLFVPTALFSEDVAYDEISDNQIKITLNKHGNQVSAIVTFNDEGLIKDFISYDRLMIDDDGSYVSVPWSTPMSDYKEVNGYFLPTKGQAIWHLAEREYPYIYLEVEDIIVNPK